MEKRRARDESTRVGGEGPWGMGIEMLMRPARLRLRRSWDSGDRGFATAVAISERVSD